MIKTICIKVFGRVQGVGFRRWGKRTALEIGGLSGWIRNTEDGAVELLVRGDEPELDQIILRCHQGPFPARVDRVQISPGKAYGFLPDVEDGKFIIV